MTDGDARGEVVRTKVPSGDDWDEVVRFSARLPSLPAAQAHVFDFAEVTFSTPGWMVLTADALKNFRKDRPDQRCRVENYKHGGLGYASAAGFFQHFGVDWGRKPGDLGETDAFIPITVAPVDDLRERAAHGMMHHGDLIQEDAERLVRLLTRLDQGAVFETLAYAMREIVRNVVEHSMAGDYTVAAQWWPGSGRAELVVADDGVGIARSLRRNPRHDVSDDAAALRLATAPGVTSRARPGRAGDVWRNTGYGLYMTSGICRAAGRLTLTSGSAALVVDEAGDRLVPCSSPGTTVVMSLQTARLGDLDDSLAQLRNAAGHTGTRPSVASLSKRVRSTAGDPE